MTPPPSRFRNVTVEMYQNDRYVDTLSGWEADDGTFEIPDDVTDIVFYSSDGSNEPGIEFVQRVSEGTWENISRELGNDGELDGRGDIIRLPARVLAARARRDALDAINPLRRIP